MRLIVENGQGLINSNSYIELLDIENYLPSTISGEFNKLDPDLQYDRIITASMFIDYSFDWLGKRKTLEQGMQFPRIGITYQGHPIPDDLIPVQIKKASAMAVNLIMRFGMTVFQQTAEAQVKKEKLGPLETEYFEAVKEEYQFSSEYSDINNILRGLFRRVKKEGIITAEVLRR